MKKLFNVRDYMFDANDVIKLGYYVAEQRCDYDGVTMMNREDIKQLAEEEPEDERFAEALDSMGEYDMAIYCHDGTIKTGSEEELVPIIVDGIEGWLYGHNFLKIIDNLRLHPKRDDRPEMIVGYQLVDCDQMKDEMEAHEEYHEKGLTVVRTSPDDELDGRYKFLGTFNGFGEARDCVDREQRADEDNDAVYEGQNFFYIVNNSKIVNVIVY